MDVVSKNIGCVIVTYNRLSMLRKALQAYEALVVKPMYILVVDNHSQDGTREYLEAWQHEKVDYQKIVVTLGENLGGAGGFHAGLEQALQLPAEWIWVADDDACPDKAAIQYLDERIEQGTDGISALCAAVIENGEISIDHRRNLVRHGLTLQKEIIPLVAYNQKEFPLQIFSYVGAVLSKQTLEQVGLTKAEYFIHYDDTEHSIRVAQAGKILCIPAAKVEHFPPALQSNKPDWRFYYNARNTYALEKSHYYGVYLWHVVSDLVDIGVHFLTGRKKNKYRVKWSALQDAVRGRMGLHKLYRPGWQPNFEA